MKLKIKAIGAIVFLQLFSGSGSTQISNSIPVQPRTIITNGTISYFKDRTIKPPTMSADGASLDSPTSTINFLALEGITSVPDTDGAVGTNFLMTMLNTGVKAHTRGGVTMNSNSLAGFWSSTNINITATNIVFDPRVVYDPYNDRWIATAAVDYFSINSAILIGVSRTSNPTNFGDGSWNLHRVKADTNNQLWADRPSVGFNKDWIVMQVNMFNVSNNAFNRSHIWVFNKTNLYAGGFTSPTFLVHSNSYGGNDNLAGNETPAATYDNSSSTLYLVQNANGANASGGVIRLFSITGTLGSETLNYVTNPCYIVATGNTWADTITTGVQEIFFLPQSSNTNKIQAPPDSYFSGVVYRNGSLWCAQTIFLPPADNPTRSAVQWWQIKPDTKEILQRGRIDDSSGVNFYAFPSIGVNQFSDVLIGYSSFSANQYPSANYSFRAFYDAANDLRNPRIYQAGLAPYADLAGLHRRWGDYSSTQVDPLNDKDLWTIQEYANNNYTVDPDSHTTNYDSWATRWAQVKVDLPANDNFSAYSSISGVQGTTNGTLVRATLETGEPSHGNNANTPSVWYRWTAPTNGNVAIGLTNNGSVGIIDTVLAVYTGTSVASLTLVTNNHGGTVGSQVVFNASSNTTYQIAAAGWNGSYGDFSLNWIQPTAPYFTLHPRGFDVVAGSNITFTATAIAAPAPAYQWRFFSTNVSGATSSSYTKNNVQTNDTGDYTAVATNTAGSVTSSVAHLQVYVSATPLLNQISYVSNSIRFLVSGVTGAQYVVEASTNLINWTKITTNITTFTNIDRDMTNYSKRFYRGLYQP